MGVRAHIAVRFPDGGTVWLYTHWEGACVEDVARAALVRGRDRWRDPAYIARIIFSEMTRGMEDETTGYGIQLEPAGDADVDSVLVDTGTLHVCRLTPSGREGARVSFAAFTEGTPLPRVPHEEAAA